MKTPVSDTPRVNALAEKTEHLGPGSRALYQGELWSLARQLERELAQARMANGCTRGQRTTQWCAELNNAVEQAYERAIKACKHNASLYPEGGTGWESSLECAAAIHALKLSSPSFP